MGKKCEDLEKDKYSYVSEKRLESARGWVLANDALMITDVLMNGE